MDRNSIIGLLLIGGILIGWLVLSQPSAEELAKQKAVADSTAQYIETQKAKIAADSIAKLTGTPVADSNSTTAVLNDSVKLALQQKAYGDFAEAAKGEDKTIVIENDLMKVNIAAKGGRIASVELKNFKTYDQKPLVLFDADSSQQSISFFAFGKKFSTDSMYFTPESADFKVSGADNKKLAMRLYAGSKDKYLEYVYTLKGDDYMMDFEINTVGLQNTISNATKSLTLNWAMHTPSQEQGFDNQSRNSTIYYNTTEEGTDKISEASSELKSIEHKTKWIGFKQQFFTSVIIAKNEFEKPSVETKILHGSKKYIKNYAATIPLEYNPANNQSYAMQLYFGPNHYQTLKKYDLDLEKQINLGWKIFGWLNRFLVIPIFNFLDGFNLNYGIIILILTIIIKLLLLPIAYRTVLSSAKMRVLKPEMDEINEKFKDGDPVKKQQATMALYKSASVNPLAGCIPVLLQMPILIALFNFFPASIELRQQGFLWAHDLSTYDSVWDFGFAIPWYGDHMSLFALLMTGSTLLYTWSNSQLMGNTNQMPGMKWMMYLMPIFFLGFLNNYSAGLSWYYFLANMFTFGQTWVMQKFVINHDKLHAKIQENKKKPKKVSKFQQKLEEMAKQQQQQRKK
jgi:YidC/Oxa1 family membrane protein insertase